MSFPKNPPWQRNTNISNAGGQPGIANLQAQMGLLNPNLVGFQQNQPAFNQNIGLQQQQQQQQQPNILLSQMPPNQLFTQAVSYPAPRALNSLAFAANNNNPPLQHPPQHQHPPPSSQIQQSQNSQAQSNLNKNQRTFSGTGFVTKMQNDFGFIDEEVYFHKNVCVKGIIPKVGDRVLVEANYNPTMAFKWNATRIQFLTPAQNVSVPRNYPSVSTKSSGYNAVPPPSENGNYNSNNRNQNRNRNATPPPPRRSSPDRHKRSRESRQRESDIEEIERKRRRDEREKERERYRDKREHSIEKRERSPVRRSSPKRRKNRVVPRYMVQIPKVSLTMSEADVLELRRRYANLYVPSDFFFTQMSWVDAFPPNAPFSIQKPCSFHIMHKDVESINDNEINADPSDADYLFSAKVMLMGVPPITDIYHKCFATAEEKDRDDDRDYIHPTRLINFLVGIRGKNETMAIGGPWSRSLDGDNPESDSSVLIRTAIRNCKALTGIDLSRCSQWYRFVELYYRRSESCHKGRLIPARVETVVIFLPDVRSCIPTLIEWDGLHNIYKRTLDRVLNHNNTTTITTPVGTTNSTAVAESSTSVVGGAVTAAAVSVAVTTTIIDDVIHSSQKQQQTSPVLQEDVSVPVTIAGVNDVCSSSSGSCSLGIDSDITNVIINSVPVDADDDGGIVMAIEKDDNQELIDVKREPTYFADLDLKTMKLTDLREELIARTLSAKGLKAQLIARLTKALKAEADVASNKETIEDVIPITDIEEELPVDDLMETENDMSDMVVIDEYDSTKTKEKCTEKKSEIKIFDEKERQLLEKRYALPSNSHIIVHPSRTAKSGKFDCTVMSLSLLLDYRPEDTKEHSFEVSLFAELFNEMLMRDFGFNIYKALYAMPEKSKEEVKLKDDDKKKDDKKKDDKRADNDLDRFEKDDKDGEKDKEDKDQMDQILDDEPIKIFDEKDKRSDDKKDNKERDRDNDRDRDNKTKSRHKDDDSDDDDYSIKSADRKKKDRERHKYFTADQDLLLSFVYFDQTHCGYIFEKDIEDLFYTLGLNLSRAQTRKLVGKVISRDSLYYRKLTDRPKDDEDGKDCDTSKTNQNDLIEIAKGNKYFLPVFKSDRPQQVQTVPNNNKKQIENNLQNDNNIDVPESLNGMVIHKGGFLDLEKLLEQMKRSEKAREDTEQILVELRKQNSDLTSSHSKAQSKIKDLTSDLKSSNRKLCDTEQSLSSSNKKISEYYSVLSSVYDKISPVFIKSEKSSSRNESSRDTKDKDREKEREKEREKDRERDSESKDSAKFESLKKDDLKIEMDTKKEK